MFLCGDDVEAKAMVTQLGEDLGFEMLDAGPLTIAWLLTFALETITIMPLPIAAGVLGMQRITAADGPSSSSNTLMPVPAAISRTRVGADAAARRAISSAKSGKNTGPSP